MPAPSLRGWAGFWTWLTLDRRFPFDAYLDKLAFNNHTATALAHFNRPNGMPRENPRMETPELAELIARRVRRLNLNTPSVRPLVYIFNRWQRPWENRYLPPYNQAWVKMLSEATEGLDLLWSACLEPLPESEHLIIQTREWLVRNDPRLTTHNGKFYVGGMDYYEAGVPSGGGCEGADFLNGDHHPRNSDCGTWLQEFNPIHQVEKIRAVPEAMGLLMVTKMTLEGTEYNIPGWPKNPNVADFDNAAAWAAMGERAGAVPDPIPGPDPDPDPEPPHDPDLRRIKDRLGWKWDLDQAMYPLSDESVKNTRRVFVNHLQAQAAERKLMLDAGLLDG